MLLDQPILTLKPQSSCYILKNNLKATTLNFFNFVRKRTNIKFCKQSNQSIVKHLNLKVLKKLRILIIYLLCGFRVRWPDPNTAFNQSEHPLYTWALFICAVKPVWPIFSKQEWRFQERKPFKNSRLRPRRRRWFDIRVEYESEVRLEFCFFGQTGRTVQMECASCYFVIYVLQLSVRNSSTQGQK